MYTLEGIIGPENGKQQLQKLGVCVLYGVATTLETVCTLRSCSSSCKYILSRRADSPSLPSGLKILPSLHLASDESRIGRGDTAFGSVLRILPRALIENRSPSPEAKKGFSWR